MLGGGVNNATAMRHWVDKFLDAGYGGVCLLDDKAKDCGYCSLPDYWEDEVAYVASKARARRRQQQRQGAGDAHAHGGAAAARRG